jgi:glycopeptide antibiotics resistance protein
MKIGLLIVFSLYILILTKLILLKYFYIGNIKQYIDFTYDSYYWNTHNFIPFSTILGYLFYLNEINFTIRLHNLAGNLVGFIPLGFLLPLISRNFQSTIKIVLAAFSLSLFFEVSQLLFKLGSFDVDDLILNTLGAIIGYLLLKVVLTIHHSLKGNARNSQASHYFK